MSKISPRKFYQSQRDDKRGGDEAPPVPHLAVRVDANAIAPIEPGTHMFIVRDPRRVDGVFEIVFEKIKFKQNVPIELHFKVPSDKPNSTRKMVATIAWLGLYSSWLEDEQKRVAAEELEKRGHPNPDCQACHGIGVVDPTGDSDPTPCPGCWPE